MIGFEVFAAAMYSEPLVSANWSAAALSFESAALKMSP